MTIRTELVTYQHGETLLEGYMAWDDGAAGERPGVLVSHAWRGRTSFEEEKARLLAEQGYVGFALDVYGQGVQGSNPEENAALMQPFLDNRPMLQERLHLVLETFRGQQLVNAGKVAAIGYCFGGLCVLDIARSGADVAGVVSLHGLFSAPGNTEGTSISAKVLALHGWDDPMVPPDAVTGLAAELSAGGADWQIHGYGGTGHAFTNPEANDPGHGLVYNERADARSWQALSNFLSECFA